MRKIICSIMLVGLLAFGVTAIADVQINHNTAFVIDVKNVAGTCHVQVIFAKKVNTQIAEKITASAMKSAIHFRKEDYDIVGSSWLIPNGNENIAKPISFSKSRYLIIKKGSTNVIPYKP